MGQLEGNFWRNTVKENVTGRWVRIETPVTGSFPDCVALIDGVTALIELKSKNKLVPRLGCTALQKQFLGKWSAEGGVAFLLARIGGDMFLIRGDMVLGTGTMAEWQQVATLQGPVRGWLWAKMCDMIARNQGPP